MKWNTAIFFFTCSSLATNASLRISTLRFGVSILVRLSSIASLTVALIEVNELVCGSETGTTRDDVKCLGGFGQCHQRTESRRVCLRAVCLKSSPSWIDFGTPNHNALTARYRQMFWSIQALPFSGSWLIHPPILLHRYQMQRTTLSRGHLKMNSQNFKF